MNVCNNNNQTYSAWTIQGLNQCSIGIYNEDVTFFEWIRIWDSTIILFSTPCRSTYHAKAFISRQNCPIINMIKNGIEQIITWIYKDSLVLRYPPNIDLWLVLQLQYPWVGSLIYLLILINDTMHTLHTGPNPMIKRQRTSSS